MNADLEDFTSDPIARALANGGERGYVRGARDERARIRTELEAWLIGDLACEDAGLVSGRRIIDEIERICPMERSDPEGG